MVFGFGDDGSLDKWTIARSVLIGFLGLIFFRILLFVFRWRSDAKKRLRQLSEARKHPFRMVRQTDKMAGSTHRIKMLELRPSFPDEHKDWRFVSLGEYLSQLRPGMIPDSMTPDEMPQWIQGELDAAMAATLLKAVGPRLGAAALPFLGKVPTEGISGSIFSRLSTIVTSRVAASAVSQDRSTVENEKKDHGALPLTVGSFGAMADANAAIQESRPKVISPTSPLKVMFDVGEIAYDPDFGVFIDDDPEHETKSDERSTSPLMPNPFVISRDWEKALEGMIHMMQQQLGNFDPESQSMGEPKPIHEAILPGLHLGYGDAKCTHTNREIVRNRLLSCLLNRLGANYYFVYAQEGSDSTTPEPFVVKMDQNGEDITKPAEFVEALMDSGHTVVCCPKALITTFGVAFCIKEDDGGWSNVPLAYFLRSGYETDDGKGSHVYLPHGGLNFEITGPLIGVDSQGKSNRCNIQHYLAIEGLCGWHSNHNPDLPWLRPVAFCDPFHGSEALRAVRTAALSAVILNDVATTLNLPHGGYGLTGVCNDTAALVEHAMRGKTNVYPITSIGRFMMHSIRHAKLLRNGLSVQAGMEKEVASLNDLIHAMKNLPNDLHASPSGTSDAIRRILYNIQPPYPFELMLEAKDIMERLEAEYQTN